MKKIAFFIIIFVFLGLCFQPPLNADEGKDLFVKKCGKCHTQGDAPDFAPVKYASSQWKRFFSRDKHKRKKDFSNEITPEEIKLIEKFLIDHAADSDLPIAAGMR